MSALLIAGLALVAVLVVPAVIWWIARRDLTAGRLLRGALARPALLLLRPVALGIALVRSIAGGRTWAAGGAGVPLTTEALNDSAPGRSVFVDVTGRRRRRVWLVANCAAFAGMSYVMIVGYALASAPVSPHWDAADPDRYHPVPAPLVTDEPEPEPEPDGLPARDVDAVPVNVVGRGPLPRSTPMPAPSSPPGPSPSASPPVPSATPSPRRPPSPDPVPPPSRTPPAPPLPAPSEVPPAPPSPPPRPSPPSPSSVPTPPRSDPDPAQHGGRALPPARLGGFAAVGRGGA